MLRLRSVPYSDTHKGVHRSLTLSGINSSAVFITAMGAESLDRSQPYILRLIELIRVRIIGFLN